MWQMNRRQLQGSSKYKIQEKYYKYYYILNLFKHSFSFNTYKVLNKNLNFVHTPKQYGQKQLDTDTEYFFLLLKVSAHIKDANETKKSDQIYQPFKFKNKTKWLPKETHQIPKTFIDLVQNDISEIKMKKVKNPLSNLSNGEQVAMKHLAKRRDIDKGI